MNPGDYARRICSDISFYPLVLPNRIYKVIKATIGTDGLPLVEIEHKEGTDVMYARRFELVENPTKFERALYDV